MFGQDAGSQSAAEARAADDYVPFEVIEGRQSSPYLLLCDHATNRMPARYGTLGLPPSELERHIGYDIGAEAVTRHLAARLGCPAVLSRFSRLLIDPNRGADDPTLIMRLSDGAVVPGNAGVDATERRVRTERYYEPYHRAIEGQVAAATAAGRPPALVSIHSFTPLWRGIRRPWEIGILWDGDPRLPVPMLEMLARDGTLTVGDNEPYSGRLKGDTMYRHGTQGGLAHALVEVRQDLIADAAGATRWGDLLGDVLEALADTPGLNECATAA